MNGDFYAYIMTGYSHLPREVNCDVWGEGEGIAWSVFFEIGNCVEHLKLG